MGSMTRAEMEADVEGLCDNTGQSTMVQTRLQWALDAIAGLHPWKLLKAEDVTLYMKPSVGTYAIPSAMRTVSLVRVIKDDAGDGKVIEYLDAEEFDDAHPYPAGEAEGRPLAWTQRGANIIVNRYPGPSQVSLVTGTDSNVYSCILNHTAAAANTPITGADYATYWAASSSASTPATWAAATSYFCEKFYLTGNAWPTALSADDSTSDLDKTLDQAIIYWTTGLMFDYMQEEEVGNYWNQKARAVAGDAWGVEVAMSAG